VRILAVSHAYPNRQSSAHGVFIHRLHLGLRRLGVEVETLQLSEWAPPWPVASLFAPWSEARARRRAMHESLDGLTIHHPAVVIPRPSRFFRTDLWDRSVESLVRYVQRRPALRAADLVLGHFMVPDGYHALGLGRALGIPVAAVAWGDDVHAFPRGSAEWRSRLERVLSGVQLPIACSHRLAEDANAWLAQPRDDWEVVYAGVDLERFRPSRSDVVERRAAFPALSATRDDGARVLLMIGQATVAKGYAELLTAWHALSEDWPTWHLVMAGAPGEIDVPREITTRGLTRAHWVGPQPSERMPTLMAASDAFVLPSHDEGLSISVLEALACGLPTVTTDVGGHAEVIRDRSEGWLVPPRDTDALVRALRDMMAGAAAGAERSSGARRAAERIGTPERNAVRLREILQRRLSTRPTSVDGAAPRARALTTP
jgi:teichuronic acid biosynthesis glycosyltransferase TuaC